jgi:predicted dehydrogenase
MSDRTPGCTGQNRRTFLKTATAASAGATALWASSVAANAYATGSETVKIALIGCGSRGAGAVAQALATGPNVKLWAMADAFDDRLEGSLRSLAAAVKENAAQDAAAIDVPKERRFIGLDAYRKAIESGVDVVLLTGPPGFRPQHFEYAVNAGKHVFMEKPVATDAVGVRRVLASAEVAKRKGLKVGVGLQRHHDASYQEAIKRIHDGALGRIVTLRCYWNSGPPAKTAIPRGNMTELEYQVRNWYFFDWLSGDHICEQHIHNIDVGNWIKQAQPVEAVGMGGRQVRTGKEYGNIFDHHAVEFTYADGTKMFSYCRQMPGCKNLVAEFAEGTQGAAELGNVRFALTRGDEILWRAPGRRQAKGANPYQVEHDVLFDAVLNNKPHNEAEFGALSTMTAILGRLATYSGQAVTWEQAFKSDRRLTTDAESWDAPAPVQPNPDGSYPIPVPGVTQVV